MCEYSYKVKYKILLAYIVYTASIYGSGNIYISQTILY